MGLMKKLTSAIVASSLVFSLVGTAAAYQPKDGETAGARMQKLGIIQGRDGSGDLQLNSTITRAEFVTTMVKAFGKEDVAKYLTGSTVFPDIANHWASGYIAMAVNIAKEAGGDAIGTDKGTFDPQGQLTPAQAVAFLMKFFGVKRDTTKAWPQDYLSAAVQANLITADDATTVAQQGNTAATRGLVFYLLDNSFYTRKDANGQTVYTKYNAKAPVLEAAAAKTTTADTKVTVSGTVKDAVELNVGANKVTFGADGAFSYDYPVVMGDNTITVQAKSLAGVTATKTLTVTRTTGAAATIEAQLSAQLLKAGTTADLTYVVKDKNGNEIKDAVVAVDVDKAVGTYANGKLTAAAVPGTGKVTLTSGDAKVSLDVAVVAGDLAKITVEGAASAKLGQAITFTAKGFDAAGNKVDLTNVTWSASKGGVINPTTGEFAGTASGNVTVTAAVGNVTGTSTVAIYGDATALTLDVPTGLIANGQDTKTLSVKMVDASGTLVQTSGQDVTVSLSGGKIMFKDADGVAQDTMTVKSVNGVAQFTLWQQAADVFNADDYKASTNSISAISGTLTGAVGQVSSIAPTVGSVALFTSPAATTFESTGSVTLNAKIQDTTGAQIPAPAAFDIVLTNNSTGVVALDNTTMSFTADTMDPTATVTMSFKGVEGAVAVSGTTTAGYTITSVNGTTKIAGPAQKMIVTQAPVDVTAGDDITMKVAIQDFLGTTKINDTTTSVDVTAKDKDGNVVETVSGTANHGVVTLTFTGLKAITLVGTYSFTVSSTGLVAPAAVTAKVSPAAADHLANLKINATATDALDPYTLVANGSQTANVTVEWQDQYNNPVTSATNAVTFKSTDGTVDAVSGITADGITVNAVNGVASAVVTAGIKDGATDTIQVVAKKADGTTLYTGSVGSGSELAAYVKTEIVGAPANIQNAAVSNATPTAGADFTVSYDIVDATSGSPRHVTTDQGRAVTLTIYNADDDSVAGTQNATTLNGTAKFTVNLTKVTTKGYYFKATTNINGKDLSTAIDGTELAAAPVAAAPASVTVYAPVTSVETTTVLSQAIYTVAKDAFGNTLKGAKIEDFAWTVNGSTTIAPRLTLELGASNYTYTASNGEESVVLSDKDGLATVNGTANIPVTATTITTYMAGPAYQVKVITNGSATAGDDATITVGIYDGAGRLKTGDNDTQVTLEQTGTTPAAITKISGKTVTGGKYTFTVPGTEAVKVGTYSFKASAVSGIVNLVADSTVKLVATAGAASDVSALNDITLTANGSQSALLTFQVVDKNGNPITSAGGTMTFTTSGTGAVLLSTSAPIVNGKATVQVKATTQSGVLTVTPAIANQTLNFNPATITVNAGAPVAATSAATLNATTLYVVLRDVNGNAVSGFATKLAMLDKDGKPVVGDFTEVGNGVYTATGTGAASVTVQVTATTSFSITVH